MPGVPLPGMNEHVVRKGGPGITDFLLQKAGVPQPRAIPSAAGLLEVAAIGPPAGLQRIELYPRPWQGWWIPGGWCRCWGRDFVTQATHCTADYESRRPLQQAPTGNQLGSFFLSFHNVLLCRKLSVLGSTM
jgi:hypothetical protein